MAILFVKPSKIGGEEFRGYSKVDYDYSDNERQKQIMLSLGARANLKVVLRNGDVQTYSPGKFLKAISCGSCNCSDIIQMWAKNQ